MNTAGRLVKLVTKMMTMIMTTEPVVGSVSVGTTRLEVRLILVSDWCAGWKTFTCILGGHYGGNDEDDDSGESEDETDDEADDDDQRDDADSDNSDDHESGKEDEDKNWQQHVFIYCYATMDLCWCMIMKDYFFLFTNILSAINFFYIDNVQANNKHKR